jgi:hypothetical protein
LFRQAERLQQKGVIFFTSVQEGESFLHVFYKGEVIAEGEYHAVRKALNDVLSKEGLALEKTLDLFADMGRIDQAVKKLGITIRIPQNTLNAIESTRRMQKIYTTLKSMKGSNKFNPKKNKLVENNKEVPLSSNGISADFENTPYLYKTNGDEKNIVKIKLTGSRALDEKLAYELAGIKPSDVTLKIMFGIT